MLDMKKYEQGLLGVDEDSLWVESAHLRTDDGMCFMTLSQARMNLSVTDIAVAVTVGEIEHHHLAQRFDAGGYNLDPEIISCTDYKFGIISLMSEGYEPRITGTREDGLPEMRLANKRG